MSETKKAEDPFEGFPKARVLRAGLVAGGLLALWFGVRSTAWWFGDLSVGKSLRLLIDGNPNTLVLTGAFILAGWLLCFGLFYRHFALLMPGLIDWMLGSLVLAVLVLTSFSMQSDYGFKRSLLVLIWAVFPGLLLWGHRLVMKGRPVLKGQEGRARFFRVLDQVLFSFMVFGEMVLLGRCVEYALEVPKYLPYQQYDLATALGIMSLMLGLFCALLGALFILPRGWFGQRPRLFNSVLFLLPVLYLGPILIRFAWFPGTEPMLDLTVLSAFGLIYLVPLMRASWLLNEHLRVRKERNQEW